MDNRKTLIRFFTIADFEEEELWLREQHKSGWKLAKMTPPCFYVFEKCAPEDVAYRLDYKNNSETGDYFQLFRDYGWEYIGRCSSKGESNPVGFCGLISAHTASKSLKIQQVFSADFSLSGQKSAPQKLLRT